MVAIETSEDEVSPETEEEDEEEEEEDEDEEEDNEDEGFPFFTGDWKRNKRDEQVFNGHAGHVVRLLRYVQLSGTCRTVLSRCADVSEQKERRTSS